MNNNNRLYYQIINPNSNININSNSIIKKINNIKCNNSNNKDKF